MLDCINQLPNNWEIKIVNWPVNSEAPFEFKFSNNIEVISRNQLTNKDLSKFFSDVKPNLVLVSGWIDKGYLKALNNQHGIKKRVLMMDTAWKGSVKQKVALLGLKPLIKGLFSHAFVSGEQQALYAQKLGINPEAIHQGYYSADVDYFNGIYNKREKVTFTNKILYLGRYVKHKGIFELWEAFAEIIKENQNLQHWELVCAGTGDQWENRVVHPNIKHLGFLQPNEMEPVLLDTSIYILPSHFEPWGVSVHEMAAAGFPLLLSEEVGSKEAFLEEGKNGFSFPAKNKQALKASLLKMMQLPESELQEMGKHSNQLAQKITPQKWVETIQSILED
jgi:glycosyltransferase involved in cell wall biosynthesis